MPISGSASYIPTLQAFLAHWAECNTALGALTPPDELTLGGSLLAQATPVVRTDLAQLYADLLEKHGEVTAALVEVDFARSDLADLKARLVQRVGEFTGKVRSKVPKSKFERALPPLPDTSNSLNVLQNAVGRVKAIWLSLNGSGITGVTLPLVLQGGYAVAALTADLTALPGAFLAVTDTGSAVKLLQEERNDLQDVIYPLFKAYRLEVPATFPAGNALVDSLPALTPAPGSTPDPVVLTGVLDGPTNKARLTWTASTNPELDHYEVRAVPGGTYNTDDEVAVATIDKDATRELLTDHFLTDPGQTASFKVYVVLTTDNEAGSNAESVTRPV